MADASRDACESILRIIARQDAAWCAGDAAAFAGYVMPDVIFTNVVGMFSVGIEPFIAQHEHIFSTIYRGSTLAQQVEHLKLATADVAIVDTLTSVRGFSHLPTGAVGTDGVFHTRLQQVMVQRDGIWRVQAFHNVPVYPVEAAPT